MLLCTEEKKDCRENANLQLDADLRTSYDNSNRRRLPSTTFKRTELKGGKIFLKNWKLSVNSQSCWCTAFCTVSRTAPWPAPRLPRSQPSSSELLLATKAHFVQHCWTRCSAQLRAPPHRPPTFWPVTSCSSHPLWRHWGTALNSIMEPVSPAQSGLWVRALLLRCYTALTSSSQVRIYQGVSGDNSPAPDTSAGITATVTICFCPVDPACVS